MQENTQNVNEPSSSNDLLNSLQNKLSDLKEKAGEALETAEEKAKELWNEASNSETVKEAKEKLEDLTDGAKGLWNKLVDKIDGDNDATNPK